MATIKVFFDEHGNTGQHLLDQEQPWFVLASNDFSVSEAEVLLEPLRSQAHGEVKFKTLRKTPSGRARLVRFLVDPRVNQARIAAYVVEKRYMVFTKLVDIVMESLLHATTGTDLYQRGANIATANMLYYVLPTFCGTAPTDAMLETFVALLRRRDDETVERYLVAGDNLINCCSDPETADFLSPFFARAAVPIWLDGQPQNAMDPAIPALFTLVDTWGRRKGHRFDIVHDNSKPIAAAEDWFKSVMAEPGANSTLVGYDRRKFLFPLRAAGLEHADSMSFPQLQIADVCAGLVSYYLQAVRSGKKDEICDIVDTTGALGWVVNAMIPSTDVTPATLGTDEESGSSPIDPVVQRTR